VAAFQPIDRDHTEKGTGDQEPWVGGPEQEAVRRHFIETLYQLMPYLYTLADEASRTGLPLLRPLFLEFPDAAPDRHPIDIDREAASVFLLGRDLLIAPAPYPDELDVYNVEFPSSNWYDYWTGMKIVPPVTPADQIMTAVPAQSAPVVVRISPELAKLPVFVRAGSILPIAPIVQSTNETPNGPLTLRVYVGNQCMEELYQDDGKTYAYQRGNYLRMNFSCEETMGAITSSNTIGACTAVPMANTPVTVDAVNPEGILSASRIPPVISPEYRRQMQAMPVDKAKLSALSEIATSYLFIRDAHTVQQGVSAILQARTMDEVQAQSVICERTIRHEHQGLLQEACATVYEASMAQIGFTQVERTVTGSGVIRTIGMDVRGRTLVNEISLHDEEVATESEVLGVGDSTCSAVLDELGRALERNGLRSGDASRRPTGGICQSQAALDYIGKHASSVLRRSGKSLAKVGLQ
jgi:hypothetical protein